MHGQQNIKKMHLMFGRAYGSEHDTCHMYQEHFSHIPDQKTFFTMDGLEKKVQLTGK